jgi:hypothetical protein
MMEHGSIVLEVPPGGRLDHAEIMALYFGQKADAADGAGPSRSPHPGREPR